MKRLAAIIEARPEFLPACSGPDRGGLRLDTGNGSIRLTYSEKGVSDVLVESAEADEVMEQVFVLVTQRMATENWSTSQTPIRADEMAALSSLPVAEMRRMAEVLQSNEAVIQFRLMNSLNPEWGQRQLDRSAKRARQIQTFFDGDRP
jgi:hypothetical protein